MHHTESDVPKVRSDSRRGERCWHFTSSAISYQISPKMRFDRADHSEFSPSSQDPIHAILMQFSRNKTCVVIALVLMTFPISSDLLAPRTRQSNLVEIKRTSKSGTVYQYMSPVTPVSWESEMVSFQNNFFDFWKTRQNPIVFGWSSRLCGCPKS